MPAMLLSSYVVPHLHGQMVCQPTGSAAPRDLAVEPRALSNLPSQVLHFRCLHNTLNNTWICFNFLNLKVFHSGFGQTACWNFLTLHILQEFKLQSFLLQPLKWMLIFSVPFHFYLYLCFFIHQMSVSGTAIFCLCRGWNKVIPSMFAVGFSF